VEHPDLGKLSLLLLDLKSHVLPQAEPERDHSPDAEKLAAFLEKLRRPLEESEASGMLADPFQAAKLGRDEGRNANVLAWFMLWRNHHGLGPIFLNQLLSTVCNHAGIPTAASSRHCIVSTETLADGGVENRVDILIDDPQIFVIIEVKIDAPEQPFQLARYCEIACRRATGRPWAVIYLTKDGKAATTAGDWSSKVIRMSWKQIARMLRASVEEQDRRSIAMFLVGAFTRHIERTIGGRQ
jgi:hypothetical protein